MKILKKEKLLLKILKKNQQIYDEQKKLVDKYKELTKKQENQEFWINSTKYLAFIFILFRTYVISQQFQFL